MNGFGTDRVPGRVPLPRQLVVEKIALTMPPRETFEAQLTDVVRRRQDIESLDVIQRLLSSTGPYPNHGRFFLHSPSDLQLLVAAERTRPPNSPNSTGSRETLLTVFAAVSAAHPQLVQTRPASVISAFRPAQSGDDPWHANLSANVSVSPLQVLFPTAAAVQACLASMRQLAQFPVEHWQQTWRFRFSPNCETLN